MPRIPSPAAGVPRFGLFGEPVGAPAGPLLHVEPIRVRSRPRDWQIHAHAHDNLLQAIIVRRGWVELRLDGQCALAQAPLVLCVPPGVVHAYRFDPAIRGEVVSISQALFGAAEDAQLTALLAPLHGAPWLLQPGARGLRELAPLVAQIQGESAAARAGGSLMQGYLARCLLLWLRRFHDEKRSSPLPLQPSSARLLRFRQLVEQEFLTHRTVGEYARTLGMTERALRRLCQALAGATPGKIVEERLALEARRRLAYTHEPVAQVGYSLGFEDPAYFSRFVRRVTGQSPHALRLSAGTSAALAAKPAVSRRPRP